MLAAGWELASHTLTHPDLTTVDAARLRRELADSRALLRRRFGVAGALLLLPGRAATTRGVEAAVRAAGYAGRDDRGPGRGVARRATPYALPRIRVNGGESPAAVLPPSARPRSPAARAGGRAGGRRPPARRANGRGGRRTRGRRPPARGRGPGAGRSTPGSSASHARHGGDVVGDVHDHEARVGRRAPGRAARRRRPPVSRSGCPARPGRAGRGGPRAARLAHPLDPPVDERAHEQQHLADDLAELLLELGGTSSRSACSSAASSWTSSCAARGPRGAAQPGAGRARALRPRACAASPASRSRRGAACVICSRRSLERVVRGVRHRRSRAARRPRTRAPAGSMVVQRRRQQHRALVPVDADDQLRPELRSEMSPRCGEGQLEAQRRAVGAQLQRSETDGGAARRGRASSPSNSASPSRSSIAAPTTSSVEVRRAAAPARARTRRAPPPAAPAGARARRRSSRRPRAGRRG